MRIIATSLGVALLFVGAGVVLAGDCCAPAACDPGCAGPCVHKVCKVVVEMKKVKKHVWVVECDEFCTGLPGTGLLSRYCDRCDACEACACDDPDTCGGTCGGCDPCDPVRAQQHCPPKCGKVRSAKKLKKKEIVCEVPTYKCVVVCVPAARCGCDGCGEASPEAAPAVTTQDPMKSAPLPPVVGTSYLK